MLGVCRVGTRRIEADHAGRPLPDGTWRGLGRMLDVAAACLDRELRPPRQGDSDEGRALVVASAESNRWEALLALGQVIFGAPQWWPPARPGVASTLLGALARRRSLPDRPADAGWPSTTATGRSIPRSHTAGRWSSTRSAASSRSPTRSTGTAVPPSGWRFT
jgi:hypothetical protein